ncbi:MAG: helix-turn-helix domain-containing protein [Candidatus Binataceae bacterium]
MKARDCTAPGPITTLKEVAEYLHIHRKTVYGMIRSGQGARGRPGRGGEQRTEPYSGSEPSTGLRRPRPLRDYW